MRVNVAMLPCATMSQSLERVQVDFAWALVDRAATARIAFASAGGADRAAERLALYRGNIAAACEKALANAFPVVRRLVGDEFFGALARAYGLAHPSVSGDLNRFGEQFPDFVVAFEHTQALPYLPDVARLDWAAHRAHYAADATAPARERVGAMPPDELLACRFGLHPACEWIDSPFAIASVWFAHQPQGADQWPRAVDRPEIALVVRRQWQVEVLRSSAGEIAALTQLRSGADMEAAIAAGLHADAAFDFPKALVRWLDYCVLVD